MHNEDVPNGSPNPRRNHHVPLSDSGVRIDPVGDFPEREDHSSSADLIDFHCHRDCSSEQGRSKQSERSRIVLKCQAPQGV